jgi:3-dehydroquinate synthase
MDLDSAIEAEAGQPIPEIFATEGEAGFRLRERSALGMALAGEARVIALGGGALLDLECRALVEHAGRVICLNAASETLLTRLQAAAEERPLISRDLRGGLESLLLQRADHYASFRDVLRTDGRTPEALAWEIQVRLGLYHVKGMGLGYDVQAAPGGLERLGERLASLGLNGPVAVVSDETVGPLYTPLALAALEASGYRARAVFIPAGEAHKNLDSLTRLWEGFLKAGMERGSTVVALGGGVVGDLAGFAAATFLRGVPWVGVPTTLLAMVDASLGGKTGADLPQGKNLIGAFHPPRLVLADPRTLASLPEMELRSGMAEVVKHGVIGDPELFALCECGWEAVSARWEEIVRRGMAVKVRVIQADPFEKGRRAALNLGHTVGHGLEQASGYRLRHGEAVAIGMVIAARLSEQMGLAEEGLAGRIEAALQGLGLPTLIPAGLDQEAIRAAMRVDKKRAGGKLLFALPVRIGEVQVGIPVETSLIESVLESAQSSASISE